MSLQFGSAYASGGACQNFRAFEFSGSSGLLAFWFPLPSTSAFAKSQLASARWPPASSFARFAARTPRFFRHTAPVADLSKILGTTAGEGDRIFPLIYAELRQLARSKMANERPGHTLQATALVHEVWLRLGGQRFENRAHFFGAAAEAMRRILIESARRRARAKHGGGAVRVAADELEVAAPVPDEELLAIHETLDAFAAHDPRRAELVKLRYFVGLTIPEAAEVLGVSEPTAKRDWAYARAWLFRKIRADGLDETLPPHLGDPPGSPLTDHRSPNPGAPR